MAEGNIKTPPAELRKIEQSKLPMSAYDSDEYENNSSDREEAKRDTDDQLNNDGGE